MKKIMVFGLSGLLAACAVNPDVAMKLEKIAQRFQNHDG